MAIEDKYNKKNRYSVKILGEELLVVGDISEEYINQLSEYINAIGKEITLAYPRLPRRRLTGLAMINLADEFFKQKRKYLEQVRENARFKEEKDNLEKDLASLKKEYQELLSLLEEVDR